MLLWQLKEARACFGSRLRAQSFLVEGAWWREHGPAGHMAPESEGGRGGLWAWFAFFLLPLCSSRTPACKIGFTKCTGKYVCLLLLSKRCHWLCKGHYLSRVFWNSPMKWSGLKILLCKFWDFDVCMCLLVTAHVHCSMWKELIYRSMFLCQTSGFFINYLRMSYNAFDHIHPWALPSTPSRNSLSSLFPQNVVIPFPP